MTNFESTLNLPTEDLKERRSILEAELQKVVVEIVTADIKSALSSPLEQAGLGKLEKITWEFQGEYDDEGGTDYHPNYIQVFTEEGEIDELEGIEDIVIKVKASHSDYIFEYGVEEFVSDILHQNSSDLYDYDIEEILF